MFLKSFRSILFKTQLLGGCIIFYFLFCLFLFSHILSHQSKLHRFPDSNQGFSWRLNYFPISLSFAPVSPYILSFLSNRDDGSFHRRIIRYSLEEHFPWLLFTTLCSKDNHRSIGPGVFYLNRCNYAI